MNDHTGSDGIQSPKAPSLAGFNSHQSPAASLLLVILVLLSFKKRR